MSHFNHSPPHKEALKIKQKQLGLRVKSLKQDVNTRWNSTFDMTESVITNDYAVSGVLRTDTKYNSLLLSPEDIANLKDMQDVLLPWKKVTVLMSADSYPTLFLVAPSIHKSLTFLMLVKPTDSVMIQTMKKAMFDDLKTRYKTKNINMLLRCAAFLDPRFGTLDFIACYDDDKSDADKSKLQMLTRKGLKQTLKAR